MTPTNVFSAISVPRGGQGKSYSRQSSVSKICLVKGRMKTIGVDGAEVSLHTGPYSIVKVMCMESWLCVLDKLLLNLGFLKTINLRQ